MMTVRVHNSTTGVEMNLTVHDEMLVMWKALQDAQSEVYNQKHSGMTELDAEK